MSMDNVMLDIETLGTAPGCAVLSIGAVAFDPEAQTLGSEFYRVISAEDCRRHGLKEDQDTLKWWSEQSAEARVVLREAYSTTTTLRDVLLGFNEYLSQFDAPCVWGNGSDFDQPILIAAYAAVGVKPAWKFRNNRCYRTLHALLLSDGPLPEREGTHHNALDDARHQARVTLRLLA